MHAFPIPLVAIGPGSQPVEEPPESIGVPTDMTVFRPPINDSLAPEPVYRAALRVLQDLHDGMSAAGYSRTAPYRRSCLELAPEVMREVNEMLGQGEVSVQAPARALSAQETAFTGIWRISGPGLDLIEAGAFPGPLRELANARPQPAADAAPLPDDLMNAPALLAEIRARSAAYRAGDPAEVINLSLLPVTPADSEFLDRRLGRGGIAILSRGFGNCRITATAYPHVWWVQYFNNMDTLILNSLEVVDLPAVAEAAAEDFHDSRARLEEWIASLSEAR